MEANWGNKKRRIYESKEKREERREMLFGYLLYGSFLHEFLHKHFLFWRIWDSESEIQLLKSNREMKREERKLGNECCLLWVCDNWCFQKELLITLVSCSFLLCSVSDDGSVVRRDNQESVFYKGKKIKGKLCVFNNTFFKVWDLKS